MKNKKLHILAMPAVGGGFVAQCLEHDIAAQGKTIKSLKEAFNFAFHAEMKYLEENNLTLEDLPPAPDYYWDLFKEGHKITPVRSIAELMGGIAKPSCTPSGLPPDLSFSEELRVA